MEHHLRSNGFLMFLTHYHNDILKLYQLAFNCDPETFPDRALVTISKPFPISKIDWKQHEPLSKRIARLSSLQLSDSPSAANSGVTLTLNSSLSTSQAFHFLEVQFSERLADITLTQKSLFLLFEMAQDAYTICQFFNAQLSSNGYISHRAVYTTSGEQLESTPGFGRLFEHLKLQRIISSQGGEESRSLFSISKGAQFILQRCDEYLLAEIKLNISSYLTPREQDILALVAKGKSNPVISVTLGLRLSTVKNHLNNIYKKLGLVKRAQLIHVKN